MRPRGQTPWMRPRRGGGGPARAVASMRPRGQTPWMRINQLVSLSSSLGGFNEATGADPVDARRADVRGRRRPGGFNEATGADPVDASSTAAAVSWFQSASMRPRGQTPWMRRRLPLRPGRRRASMRPRGQTPWMRAARRSRWPRSRRFNEATGADPVDAPEDAAAVKRVSALQ